MSKVKGRSGWIAGIAASRVRRRHSAEFKARVLAACEAPGARVVAVAAAHGVHPGLIYLWRRAARTARDGRPAPVAFAHPAPFVPVTLTDALSAEATIRIRLQRGATAVQMDWPVAAAAVCAEWLRGWLR